MNIKRGTETPEKYDELSTASYFFLSSQQLLLRAVIQIWPTSPTLLPMCIYLACSTYQSIGMFPSNVLMIHRTFSGERGNLQSYVIFDATEKCLDDTPFEGKKQVYLFITNVDCRQILHLFFSSSLLFIYRCCACLLFV